MANVSLFGPMDTIQFLLGSPLSILSISGTSTSVVVDYGPDLRLRFTGTSLTFSGTEPTGGLVATILASQSADGGATFTDIGMLTINTAWQFTRAGLIAGYADENQRIQDSPGFDILRGSDQGDQIVIEGGEDQVRAGAGADLISLYIQDTLPALDIDGGVGDDTLFLSSIAFGTFTRTDMRGVTLTSIELVTIADFVTAEFTQTQALGLARVFTPSGRGQLAVYQDRAVLDLNDIAVSPGSSILLGGRGTEGADQMVGHAGMQNVLQGNGGADRLAGGGANDDLIGGSGGDSLTGGAGADELIGNGGRDVLNGGRGNDELSGDGGRDAFIFARRSGDDDLTDFRAYGRNRDTIDLTDIRGITGFSDLTQNHLDLVGGGLLLQLGNGNSVVLTNVVRADLDAGDFLFRA